MTQRPVSADTRRSFRSRLLALVLSPMIEDAFRRSLLMSDGAFFIFFQRPISLFFIGVTILLVLVNFIPWLKGRPAEAQRG